VINVHQEFPLQFNYWLFRNINVTKNNHLLCMISVIYSDKFLLHKTSDRHPERPERLQAVTQALTLETGYPSFALTRPPGHHALKDTGMGFCLFANAAIIAQYALNLYEVERVVILDWDVHHGNGTQEMVENNPQIAFCSIHQSPFFPFTGREKERGVCNTDILITVNHNFGAKTVGGSL